MPEVPPIPERPKVPARPKRRVAQQEWKHAEVLEQAKDRGLFEVRSYEQIRSHGTSAEGDISSSRTETRTLSNATVIHFTDVGYRPRDETAPAYSVYSHYSDLGYEGSGGETEVPSCRMSTGQRHLGVESPVGSVLEFEKFDGNTKEDEEAFYQKQNFTPPVREFQPEIPERPSRVSGPLYEISNASVIRSANAASGEQVHSAASVYRKEIKLVPPEPDSHTEDILGEQYSSKGSVFSDDCVKEGTTNMKPLDVSGIDLELGTIPNSPTEELNKLLSLALKDTSKDNLADDNDPMNFDAEQGTSNTIPDASFAVTKSSLKGWLGRGDHNGQQLNIAEKHTNFSIDSGTNIANLHFPDTTLGLGEGAIDIPLIDGGTISSIGLDRSDSGEKLQPLNTPVATLDPSSASQHTEKAPNVEAPSKSALQSTLDPTVSCANKAVSATDSNGNFGALQNMLVDPINEAEDTVKPPVKQPEYGNKSDTFTEDKVGTLLEEDDGQCSPELKHIIPVLTSQKEDVNKDASVDTSPSTLIETQERNVNASPTSQSPVRTTAQHSPAKASPKGDDSEKGSNNVNLNGQKKPKRVPIVPKKPSSKIAAFQELLQRQQADQYGSKTFEDQHNSSSPTRFGGSRSNFAQNLNGLFALPGMAPGNLPPVLAKKFAPPSPSEGSSSETKSKVAPAEDTDIRTSDIRTGRAKGPRGRKLPASVANIEKVTAISNNQIFTFNTWSVVFNKSTVADVIERSKTGERENSQESAVLPDNSKNSASNVNISQNEDSNSTVIDELASDPEILECITSDL